MSERTAAHDVAGRMADAAVAFLGALDEEQRALAQWPFPSDDERRRWFYTPTDHGGLTIGAMRPVQQQLAHQLVRAGTSRAGYVTVATIMGLENVLDELEGYVTRFGRERGRDPGLYYLRVFGDPAGDEPWSWRFGGHHVSIHHLVVDGAVQASTPFFLGADPAASPLLGPHLLRPLAGAEDLGRELVRALDDAQATRAIVSPAAPTDLVGANRTLLADGDGPLPLRDVWRGRFGRDIDAILVRMQNDGDRATGITPADVDAIRYSTAPKGIPATELRAGQRDVLRALLDVYVHRLPDELADAEATKYAGDGLAGLHFLWAGGTEPGRPHYYRVQGPRLVVEYDNAARGANHVHTVWRDPDGDFGDDVLARHYVHEH
jgi:hypothetical protein